MKKTVQSGVLIFNVKVGGAFGKSDKVDKSDAIVITEVGKKQNNAYLEQKGKIYSLRDLNYNFLVLDIELEGWNTMQVRL